jgi:hypothetical protein
MIKIETKYNNMTDEFNCKCDTEKTHTMEHLCLMAYLWNSINKNDPELSDGNILKAIKRIKGQLSEQGVE